MAKPGPKAKTFQVTIRGEQAEQIRQWGLTMGFAPGTEPEMVRMLVTMAIASTPLDGAIVGGQARAYREVKVWALGRLLSFFDEMQKQLKQSYVEAQS